MKRFLGYAAMLVLLSVPAFAAKNADTLTISEPVTIGTTKLPAAEYKITWTGVGDNAQVTLTHGKVTVTVPAKVVEQKHNNPSILTDTKTGTTVVEAINLSKVSVTLNSAPVSGQ